VLPAWAASTRTRGGFGRILAYLHRNADGLDVDLEMIRLGHARRCTRR